jgi:hypothetical protein
MSDTQISVHNLWRTEYVTRFYDFMNVGTNCVTYSLIVRYFVDFEAFTESHKGVVILRVAHIS